MISKLLLMQKMLMMSLTLKSANPQGSGRDQTLRKAWNSSVIDIQQYQKKKQKGVFTFTEIPSFSLSLSENLIEYKAATTDDLEWWICKFLG